jgi:hypothetical protein
MKKLTNRHDEVSDHQGRKELRDEMVFDTIMNVHGNPYNSTPQEGVIVMLNLTDPQGNATPQTSIKGGIKAMIRPLGDQAEDMFVDEICKYKNDRNALVSKILSSAEPAKSEKILGDTNGYVPSVGDVVPIYYDIEGPGPQGKKRGLRWKLQRKRRASGGFDAACIEALGGNLDASLFANGNAGGTIGQGGGVAGAPGQASGNGIGARPGTISEESMKHWPSGIIGMEKGEKSQTCDPAIFNKAIKRMDWWMNVKNNPLWADKRVPYHTNYSKTARVGKPHILTIVDATPSKKRKDRNLWTFDLTKGKNIKTAGLLVWTWSGIGRGSFSPESAYRKGGATEGPALDFNNGNNHTSPGMKVLGGKRTFKANSPPPKGSKAKRALAIYGIETWNSREPGRGAIAHETKAKRARAISFGCLATEGNIATQPTAKSVHYHAWEVWTGGSWLFVYTGDDFGPSKTDNTTDPAKVPGNVYWKAPNESTGPRPGADKRETWDWNSPLGGHATNPSKSSKKKKKKK